MDEQSNIDYAGLASYISGECAPEEQIRWEAWIGASDENRKIYEACLKLLEPGERSVSRTDPEFDSKAAWMKVKERLDAEGSVKDIGTTTRSIGWLKYAAAVLVAGLLITYLVRTNLGGDITIGQISGIQTYQLPDSSVVTLNGLASISYSEDFDDRVVDLEGRAYFEVEKLNGSPFTVYTPNAYVRVLGTAFVVEENADSVLVQVESGLVELGLTGAQETINLERHEEGIIRLADKQPVKSELDNPNELYWANKQLLYRQVQLTAVFDELGRMFDKQFSYDRDNLSACQLTAVFRNQSFEEIIRNISLSMDFDYEIAGDQVIITNARCN